MKPNQIPLTEKERTFAPELAKIIEPLILSNDGPTPGPWIVDILNHHDQYHQQVVDGMGFEYKFTPTRLRIFIKDIRERGLIRCLLATNKGYFIATTREQCEVYEQQIMENIASLEKSLAVHREQTREKFGQLDLFEQKNQQRRWIIRIEPGRCELCDEGQPVHPTYGFHRVRSLPDSLTGPFEDVPCPNVENID